MSARSVLIVDDDAGVREALAEALRDEGYQVASVGDGMDALDHLRAHPLPGLILLDWMMPRCDGSAFRLAQLADTALAHLPVVVLSADPRVRDFPEAMSASAWLRKPVTLADLLATVDRYCRA